ncbi:MAG: class IV adenylate cyclase [Candidatus Saccharibacteria bacterium]
MTSRYIEQEIKLKLNDPDGLINMLVILGAKSKGVDFQKTIRFDTKTNELEKYGTFIRVRSGHGTTITMKRKLKSENSDVFQREEIETSIGDIEKMRQIIKNLGFSKEYIMEKYRSNWSYKGAEISIDELPFGFFVEIEASPAIIKKVSNELKLNLDDKITTTYWHLLAEHNKLIGAKEENIIFTKDHISKLYK